MRVGDTLIQQGREDMLIQVREGEFLVKGKLHQVEITGKEEILFKIIAIGEREIEFKCLKQFVGRFLQAVVC